MNHPMAQLLVDCLHLDPARTDRDRLAGLFLVIVLKGAYLGGVVYVDPALRWMVDIDLLVQATNLGRAAEVLHGEGYQPIAPSDGRVDRPSLHPHHLPRFMKADGPGFEFHRRLSSADDREEPDEWWQRAVSARIAGVDVMGLCAEDLVLHLCIHASYNHRSFHFTRSFLVGAQRDVIEPLCVS